MSIYNSVIGNGNYVSGNMFDNNSSSDVEISDNRPFNIRLNDKNFNNVRKVKISLIDENGNESNFELKEPLIVVTVLKAHSLDVSSTSGNLNINYNGDNDVKINKIISTSGDIKLNSCGNIKHISTVSGDVKLNNCGTIGRVSR